MSDSAPLPESPPSSVASLRPLRVWPAIVLLVAIPLAMFIPGTIEDGPAMLWMITAFGPLLGGFLLTLWWVLASRATWWERILGAIGVITGAVVASLAAHPTMIGPGLMVLTVPLGLIAFGIGAVLISRTGSRRRILVPLLLAALGYAFGSSFRAEGMWGNFHMTLQWRWKPTVEQRWAGSSSNAGSPVSTLSAETSPELAAALANPDWPGFRGPNRDSQYSSPAIASDWTANPPQVLWTIPVGPGWSSFAVAANRLYTQEQRGEFEAVVCYDADNGKEIWASTIQSRFDDPLGGPGPRGTPTLASGSLYALGGSGHLQRLDAATGQLLWQVDLREIAQRQPPMWGFCASPLVVDDLVIVYAGGSGKLGTLAFDIQDGALRWSAPAGDHSYGSAQPMTLFGESLVAIVSNQGLDLLRPQDGTLRLQYEWPFQGYRATQPQRIDEASVLLPTGMGGGTRRLDLSMQDDRIGATEKWTSRDLKPDFNDYVVHQGFAYGFDGNIFVCIDLADGKRKWRGGRYGKGQVLALPDADQLLVLSETGDLVLLAADPSERRELAKLTVLQAKTWNHPVLIGDRLFVRNSEQAVCLRLPLISPPAATAAVEPAP